MIPNSVIGLSSRQNLIDTFIRKGMVSNREAGLALGRKMVAYQLLFHVLEGLLI